MGCTDGVLDGVWLQEGCGKGMRLCDVAERSYLQWTDKKWDGWIWECGMGVRAWVWKGVALGCGAGAECGAGLSVLVCARAEMCQVSELGRVYRKT